MRFLQPWHDAKARRRRWLAGVQAAKLRRSELEAKKIQMNQMLADRGLTWDSHPDLERLFSFLWRLTTIEHFEWTLNSVEADLEQENVECEACKERWEVAFDRAEARARDRKKTD